MFWTLPAARSPALLRLLVAFEVLADYLDCTSERAADCGIENGTQLHRAVVEALDPKLPVSDYYALHPWRDDGGYVRELVEHCRRLCSSLPSYPEAQPFISRAAHLALVLAINHEPDATVRDAELRRWAAAHFPRNDDLAWFEWTGAASAWLTVLALLAVAADPAVTQHALRATSLAYLPWVSLVGTMLDSLGDVAEDRVSGDHSYVGHYPSLVDACERISQLVSRATQELAPLPFCERHLVIAGCMVAIYLSKDSTVRLGEPRTRIARSGGPLTSFLLPILRAWRLIYGKGSA